MNIYLDSIKKRFETYKKMGDDTFAQVSDEGLLWQYNAGSNSMVIIIQHMAGNMLSRWTDLLTSDGEKPWRKRDAEFELNLTTRTELLAYWEQAWQRLFTTLQQLTTEDLDKTVYIRNEPHTVTDAINRQLAHKAYHVGQLVFIAKMLSGDNWNSLSIPRGKSENFNDLKFKQSNDQIL